MKAIKVPEGLIGPPFYHRQLQFNGLRVIESCTGSQRNQGSMFLNDHLLLVVLEGKNTITHGRMVYEVNQNEMILFNKSILIQYDKTIGQGGIYDSVLFFIKDDFILDFMKIAKINSAQTSEKEINHVKPINQRLQTFLSSVKTYFSESDRIDDGLVRLKMLELLYDLANIDNRWFRQILQLKQNIQADIPVIMEENYSNPVNVSDLAYLSGRSLSSFKRDFQTIYKVSPAQWIREKRLVKAKELLHLSDMSVTDVCYATGFENVAHFSRTFKDYFGYSPSMIKQNQDKIELSSH